MEQPSQIPKALQNKGYITIKRIYKHAKSHVFYAIRKQDLVSVEPQEGTYESLYRHVRVVKVLGHWGNTSQEEQAKQDMMTEKNFLDKVWASKPIPHLRQHLLGIYDDDSNVQGEGDIWLVMETAYPCITLEQLCKPMKGSGARIPEPLAAHIFLELGGIFASLHKDLGVAHNVFFKRNMLLGLRKENALPQIKLLDFGRITNDAQKLHYERRTFVAAMLDDFVAFNQLSCKNRFGHNDEKSCPPDVVHSPEWREFWNKLAAWSKALKNPKATEPGWDVILGEHKKTLENLRDNMSDETKTEISQLLSCLFEEAELARITDQEWAAAIESAK